MNTELNRRRPKQTNDENNRCYKLALLFVGLILLASGCGKPSETRRDNRRLMDAILTAIVIRSPKELSKDKELLSARHQAGQLSMEAFSSLNHAISMAESGEWSEAEKQLYQIRAEMPFPH